MCQIHNERNPAEWNKYTPTQEVIHPSYFKNLFEMHIVIGSYIEYKRNDFQYIPPYPLQQANITQEQAAAQANLWNPP